MNVIIERIPSKTLKRFNYFLLDSAKKIRFRPVAAALLGGFAGVSFNSTILPSVVSSLGPIDEFSARWELGGYAVYSFMVWSVGAWAARKTGNTMAGATVLGMVGLISGVLLTATAFGTETSLLLAGAAGGLVYGGVGGMLIANSLREPCVPA